MDYYLVLIVILYSFTTAKQVSGATQDDDSLLYCPGSPGAEHSECPTSDNLGTSGNHQGYHGPATDIGSSSLTEQTEVSTPRLPEGQSAVRSPVLYSQQATVFLVNNWNDLTTWNPGNKSLSVCEEHVEQAIKGYLANQMWALQVFDAWAKPGPSLLEGRSMFAGNYHQCRGIRSPEGKTGKGFGGNYCVVYLANLTVSGITDITDLMALSRVQIGTCLPDTCTQEDITQLFQERLEAMNLSSFLAAQSTDCLSEEREITTFTKIALLIVVVIGTLVISGTAVDLAAQFCKPGSTNLTPEGQVKEPEQEIKSRTTGVWVNVLLSFSAYTNGKRLLSTSQAPGSITVIQGMRFLTMAWIIIGHAYFMLIYGRASNILQANASVIRYRIFDTITNMPLGVDSFFAISGFLVSYLNLKKVIESGWKFSWRRYFIHRYWRLTPTYMVAFVSIVGLQRFFVSGPTAPTVQPTDKVACEKYWWTFLLYVNNLRKFEPDYMCFPQSWSLAADYQFYLLSPLMLLPFYYHRNYGIASCLLFILAQWILTGSLAYYFNATIGTIGQPMEYFHYIYFPFYTRIAPFSLGILTGYIMSANNGRVTMDRCVVMIGWILTAVAGLFVVFGFHGDLSGEYRSSLLVASVYNATFRTVWGACICWIIVACTSGYGGPIHAFLSWSPFTVLGRLTYTGYLIHMSVLAVILENLEQPLYLNIFAVVVYGTAGVVFTCALSAILVVCVEMPTLNLERVRDQKKNV
ncbi:unnamed protein product [Candidula unifasciata]|uniref:Nose resistant-to-fluoxetine protein N-terminal domain-containing protein n=1 Tax=Candidula unifasciata TaxID=100452 RepID=A0A8S3ZVC7_9EUPU|nr:unnamed protein product [Candidula unifasciata]